MLAALSPYRGPALLIWIGPANKSPLCRAESLGKAARGGAPHPCALLTWGGGSEQPPDSACTRVPLLARSERFLFCPAVLVVTQSPPGHRDRRRHRFQWGHPRRPRSLHGCGGTAEFTALAGGWRQQVPVGMVVPMDIPVDVPVDVPIDVPMGVPTVVLAEVPMDVPIELPVDCAQGTPHSGPYVIARSGAQGSPALLCTAQQVFMRLQSVQQSSSCGACREQLVQRLGSRARLRPML